MAITAWTSEGMSWDWHMHGAPLYPYLEALRLALIERAEFREVEVPEALTEIVRTAPLDAAWFAAFQDLITAIIPKYLNHTIGTNFDNFQSFSDWDETTILAAIGAASRLEAPSPRPHDVGADWVLQQYKLINMLRCINPDAFYNMGYSMSFYGTQYRSGYAGNYGTRAEATAAARSDLAANSWINGNELPIGYSAIELYNGTYRGHAFQSRRHYEYSHSLLQNADIFSFLWSGLWSPQWGSVTIEDIGNGGTLAPYNGAYHLFKTDLNVEPSTTISQDYESPGPDDLQFYEGEWGEVEIWEGYPQPVDVYALTASYDQATPVLVARPQFNFKDW